MSGARLDLGRSIGYSKCTEGCIDGLRALAPRSTNNVIDFRFRAALAPVDTPSVSVTDGQRGAALRPLAVTPGGAR